MQAATYSPAQIEGALGTVFAVDRQLIADGTYFVAERDSQMVGCGGWSFAVEGWPHRWRRPSRCGAAIRPAVIRWLYGDSGRTHMTLCPIALAVGCKKCPAFAVCPVKTIIGDYRPDEKASQSARKSATARRGDKRAK